MERNNEAAGNYSISIQPVVRKVPSADMCNSGMRLGEFLVAAGVLTNVHLHETIRMFHRTNMPLGKMLIYAGHVSDLDLDTALKLQEVVRLTGLPTAVALRAFDYVRKQELTLVQALRKAGIEAQVVSYSRLGVLLVDAGIISKAQYDEARRSCKRLSTPLGSMLCLMGLITEDLLGHALELQRQMRERAITKDEAILRLRHSPTFLMNRMERVVNGQLVRAGMSTKEVTVMELLSMCGAVAERHMVAAYSSGCESLSQLHMRLVDDGVLSLALLQTTQYLENAINSGEISLGSAVDTLTYIRNCEGNCPIIPMGM